MNIDGAVLAFAGFVVLLGLTLSAFASANMGQAAFRRFCPGALVFRRLGLKAGADFF